jgi:hypothetical protein
VHVAAVLIAAVNVLRPLQLDFEPPSTAGLCWWNRPGAGNMYNFLRPVCYIPFTQEDINKPEKKTSQPCTVSSLGRNNFNPFADGVTFLARDNPIMQAKINRLFDYLRSKDAKGRLCAGAIQHPTYFNGGQHDGDHPLFSLEQGRVWKVLPGDYLADKGFKIHDMLARYSAGLYKPPTRLKGQTQLTDDEVRTTMKVHMNFEFVCTFCSELIHQHLSFIILSIIAGC